jgi:hypothetical protein
LVPLGTKVDASDVSDESVLILLTMRFLPSINNPAIPDIL